MVIGMSEKQPEKKELTPPLRSQMLRYCVVVSVLQETGADEVFARVPGGKRDIAMLRKVALKLMQRTMDTVPDRQRDKMSRQWDTANVEIGVKKPQVQHDREYGMWLSNEAVREVYEASKDHCMTCQLDKHKAKKCALRAALDEMYISGVPERSENGCPYQILL
jgi:hypothetical protein